MQNFIDNIAQSDSSDLGIAKTDLKVNENKSFLSQIYVFLTFFIIKIYLRRKSRLDVNQI